MGAIKTIRTLCLAAIFFSAGCQPRDPSYSAIGDSNPGETPTTKTVRNDTPVTYLNPDLSESFVDGRDVKTVIGKATLSVRAIGELSVPTGSLVACDPFVFFDAKPFTQKVPIGTFPVLASIAQLDGEERVAYLTLKISDEPTVRWELALLQGQDTKALKPGKYFGYSVDAGTGSLMDAKAAAVFLKKLEKEAWDNKLDYTNSMMKEIDEHEVKTWSWGNFKLEESDANLITISSGLGDGSYPSYFGFDSQGRVTSFITDFLVVD